MRKRNGTILCVLLALVALTFAAVLPASAADDTLVIGVYYYDADGNLITEVYGTPLNPPYFGYNLTHAQVAFDDIAHLTARSRRHDRYTESERLHAQHGRRHSAADRSGGRHADRHRHERGQVRQHRLHRQCRRLRH